MDCCQSLILCCFNCLACLGCRRCLIESFAYFPPRPPTYTFRPEECEATLSSLRSTKQNELSAVAQQNTLDNSQYITAAPLEDSSMRFHRISSYITEKDARPYKVQKPTEPEIVLSSLKSHNLIPSPTRIPQGRKPYAVFLITKSMQAISLCQLEDIHLRGYYLQTEKRRTIVSVVHLQLTQLPSDYVILHSHGNSSDIGVLLDSYLDLSYNLGVDVVGYDYPGYGQSTGSPDDFGAMDAAETAYNFLVQDLGYERQKIILYGQSIGSGPSVMLAANPRFVVGGLIIHSGFMSGMRVVCPDARQTSKYDMFPNIEFIKHVNCLVLIMHGTRDEQINDKQVALWFLYIGQKAQELAKQTRNLFQMWCCQEGGHNNIELDDKFREEYFSVLRKYLAALKDQNNQLITKSVILKCTATRWEEQEHLNHIYYSQLKHSSEVQSMMDLLSAVSEIEQKLEKLSKWSKFPERRNSKNAHAESRSRNVQQITYVSSGVPIWTLPNKFQVDRLILIAQALDDFQQ